jgi:DNA-binding NarL/FixJ family response regulator
MLKQSFYIKSKLICGETTPCLKDDSMYSIKPQEVNDYIKPLKLYDDSTVKELDSVETLLQQSDETDLKILKLLAKGEKYEEIGAETFLSITALKYRINKMLKNKLQKLNYKSKINHVHLIFHHIKMKSLKL